MSLQRPISTITSLIKLRHSMGQLVLFLLAYIADTPMEEIASSALAKRASLFGLRAADYEIITARGIVRPPQGDQTSFWI